MIDLTKGYIEFSNIILQENYTVAVENLDSEAKINQYEELLAWAMINRASLRDATVTMENQAKIFPHIKHMIEWLRNGDFYTCPASTKYHDACTGGLLDHTLNVYNQLVSLRTVYKFHQVVEEQWWSAIFAVLVHDWCKIGRYKMYYKRVPPDWHEVPAFTYKEDGVGRFGHGTQSLIMAMQLCSTKLTSLTFEEMAAIRWHMDNWDMATYDVEDLHRCNEKIPMVRMVQFADQLAITTY